MIEDQISRLNDDYSSTGFSFKLASTDRTDNEDWFSYAEDDNDENNGMKRSLRKGGATDLNIYTVGFKKGDLLGYSTFPSEYEENPEDDGVGRWFFTVKIYRSDLSFASYSPL